MTPANGVPIDDKGIMRDLAIKQGYVPPKCTMDGFYIMAFINDGKDPCNGCTENRTICGGRPTHGITYWLDCPCGFKMDWPCPSGHIGGINDPETSYYPDIVTCRCVECGQLIEVRNKP